MEQVAEALKKIRPNDGRWDKSEESAIGKIISEANNWIDRDLMEDEIEAVLDAIIQIYGKKAPVIEWHENKDQTPLLPPQKFDWEHDVTGELYDDMYFLEERFPEHASKWADGVFGGNCFVVGDEKFYTTESTRGIGYTALIAFDQFGNGAVFVKDKF